MRYLSNLLYWIKPVVAVVLTILVILPSLFVAVALAMILIGTLTK